MGQRSRLLKVGTLWPSGCIWVHIFLSLTFSFGFHGILKRFCNWQTLSLALRQVPQAIVFPTWPPLPLEFVVPGYLDGHGVKQGLLLNCREGKGSTWCGSAAKDNGWALCFSISFCSLSCTRVWFLLHFCMWCVLLSSLFYSVVRH